MNPSNLVKWPLYYTKMDEVCLWTFSLWSLQGSSFWCYSCLGYSYMNETNVYKLVMMKPHWLTPETQQCVHPSLEEDSAEATREKNEEAEETKEHPWSYSTLNFWLKHNGSIYGSPIFTSQVGEEYQHLDTPSRFLPTKFSTISCILSHIYTFNQAIAYPPGLHINRAKTIKIVPDRCCLRLALKNESKKKRVQDLLEWRDAQ